MAQFFGRMWDRARGKLSVLRICEKVFDELSVMNTAKNTKLLDINCLHVATLMVYNSINKQMVGHHKNPPSTMVVSEKTKSYRAMNVEGITQQEFQELIMEWVRKDLRIVLVGKAAWAISVAPPLAVSAKNAARKVPRMRDVVDRVPTPLLFAVFSVGLMLLPDFVFT